jgi:hypothetical protein
MSQLTFHGLDKSSINILLSLIYFSLDFSSLLASQLSNSMWYCSEKLQTAEIKIAEYYVKYYVQNTFSNSNSDSAVSVKYLISRNYYIQISKTWYLWNNNFKYCFNKLYYDCKHWIRRLFQLLSVSVWHNHIRRILCKILCTKYVFKL